MVDVVVARWKNSHQCKISTLQKENGTYNNACSIKPQAVQILVKSLSRTESQDMIMATLKKHNKKFTTDAWKLEGVCVGPL